MNTPKSTSGSDELALDAFLPYRLSVLSNNLSHAIASVYSKQFELSIPAWRVMAVLGRFDNLSAADLVDKTAMDKVAISRAVSLLINKEYLNRKEDHEDRRRSVLTLSEKGREIYGQIVPMALNYQQQLIEDFSGDEVQQLHNLLDRLMAKAEDWKNNGLEA